MSAYKQGAAYLHFAEKKNILTDIWLGSINCFARGLTKTNSRHYISTREYIT